MHKNSEDIRNKESLTGDEVKQLNFINASPTRLFRKHYRQGLRSHIFEVLAMEDVQKEREGTVIAGTRYFPRAVPLHMLRILRARFSTLDQVLDEITKYALILKHLGPDLIARSEEFIVEYTGSGRNEIVLCGLQEYIDGAMLDPWSLFGQTPLATFYQTRFPEHDPLEERIPKALDAISKFVAKTRKMVLETGYIPDLAGNGNLLLTPGGGIKLVDINNIIEVHQNETICLDDRNYPSCDKSVEVLAILEQKLLDKKLPLKDPLYGHFLSEERKKRVRILEEKFYHSLKSPGS